MCTPNKFDTKIWSIQKKKSNFPLDKIEAINFNKNYLSCMFTWACQLPAARYLNECRRKVAFLCLKQLVFVDIHDKQKKKK